MAFSYSPYSKFRVGAAALGESGRVYTGCNVENASYGATNCAERTAVFKGVSEGERWFTMIAVVCSADTPAWPCGICRQVLSEFFPPDGKIILENGEGEILTFKLSELLPLSFSL